MARFKVSGLTELEQSFVNLEKLPYEVIWEMLVAEAEVVIKRLRQNTLNFLQGPYNKGAVAKGIKKGKVTRTKGVYTLHITFKGSQHGNRLGEIAFVNEFGKKSQTARPFIKTTMEQSSDEAIAAADKVFDKFLNSL